MAVDLSEYVDALKRAVTPIGGSVATATDAVWVGYLVDAFWEARLDGFLVGYESDEDGVVTPTDPDTPDLDRRWVSLVILYASLRGLSMQIINTQKIRAKGGPVEFEMESSANVLTEMLKQLAASKKRLLELLGSESEASDETNVMLVDAFSVRALSGASYFGSALLTEG